MIVLTVFIVIFKKRGEEGRERIYLLRIATTANASTATTTMLPKTSGLSGEKNIGSAPSINPIEGSCKSVPLPKFGYARKTESPIPVGT